MTTEAISNPTTDAPAQLDKPAEPPATPEPDPQHAELKRLRGEQRRARQRVDDVKEMLKTAKERLATIHDQIGEAIDELDQPLLPFNSNGQAPPAAAAAEPADTWRLVSIASLGLSPAVVGKLADADIDSLGELTDYKALEKPQKIKGIGVETWTKIDDSIAAYFEAHPVKAAEEQAVEEGPGDGGDEEE